MWRGINVADFEAAKVSLGLQFLAAGNALVRMVFQEKRAACRKLSFKVCRDKRLEIVASANLFASLL